MARTNTGRGGRRKRTRLERAKRRNPAREQQAKTRSTEDSQFARMDLVNGFDVEVLQHGSDFPGGFRYRNIVFRRGDDVILNSEDDPLGNIWVGQIGEIRSSKDRSTTIARVRWYYSPTDVTDHRKTFDPSQCASFERILSDAYDYASPYTFREKIYVHEYDEGALDPPMIRPTDFFVRTTLQVSKKQIKSTLALYCTYTYQPPLGRHNCLCQNPYNPYPSQVVASGGKHKHVLARPQSDVMHFCASLKCRKWYHESCLSTMGHINTTSPASTRGLQLLAVDPDSEAPFTTFAYFAEPESVEDMQSVDKVDIVSALELFQHSQSIIMHLPDSLIEIAQCPIVRCSGAADGWAIGNVSDVALARRFIYAAVEHKGRPEHSQEVRDIIERYDRRMEDIIWSSGLLRTSPSILSSDEGDSQGGGSDMHTEIMDVDGARDRDSDADAEMEALQQLCEDLTAFKGFLATVYPPYWDQRWREFHEMGELLNRDGPAFMCPQCRSAI